MALILQSVNTTMYHMQVVELLFNYYLGQEFHLYCAYSRHFQVKFSESKITTQYNKQPRAYSKNRVKKKRGCVQTILKL